MSYFDWCNHAFIVDGACTLCGMDATRAGMVIEKWEAEEGISLREGPRSRLERLIESAILEAKS